MNAYYIQDRLEAQSWARHYQQIAREEKEAELADDMEKGLPQHLFESLCIDHLQRHGASKKAITLTPGTSTTTALPAKSCVLPTTKFTTSEKAEHVSPACSALIMTLNL